MNGFDPLLLAWRDASVAPDVAVLAAHAQVDGVGVSDVSHLARGGGVDACERALIEALDRAIAELHLDRPAVDEVQLLLDIVVVRPALDSGGHHDRVDAERGHLEALADLAKAGAIAPLHPAILLRRSLHVVSCHRCLPPAARRHNDRAPPRKTQAPPGRPRPDRAGLAAQ